jgi:gentisate 1,2-dioxygenase/1-hydroxy-2-naphthoate dioxygenase
MATEVQPVKTLAEFDGVLDGRHMRGQWQYDAQLEVIKKDGPLPAGVPFLWKWELVRSSLHELSALLTETTTARRNISFINPDPRTNGTSHTLVMGMQLVFPGEIAWAHRHSINALRFVVDGSPDLYTVVDGEKCVMEDNDLVLTPAYTWHDHHNESSAPRIWIDILDVPVFGFLRQMFFETFGESVQPLRESPGDRVSRRSGLVRPAWEAAHSERIPYRYPWSETRVALDAYAKSEGSPYDGVILRYAHPITSGPTMPTIDCFVQSLEPGLETRKHRHTASAVYYVIEGEGTTIVGDKEIHWSERDSFVVPNWMWHQHVNRSKTSRAVLFSSTDAPLLSALGMYREEPEPSFGVQPYPTVPADQAYGSRTRR